jgi:hypothetical protein
LQQNNPEWKPPHPHTSSDPIDLSAMGNKASSMSPT